MKYTIIPREMVPPEALDGYTLPENCAISAAIEGDQVVAVWCAQAVLHVEPVWVRKDYRGHPTILRRLWENLQKVLAGIGAQQAVSVILDSNPSTKRLAEWAGATRIPGSVWMVKVGGDGCRP